jgi:hypothetical protein
MELVDVIVGRIIIQMGEFEFEKAILRELSRVVWTGHLFLTRIVVEHTILRVQRRSERIEP